MRAIPIYQCRLCGCAVRLDPVDLEHVQDLKFMAVRTHECWDKRLGVMDMKGAEPVNEEGNTT